MKTILPDFSPAQLALSGQLQVLIRAEIATAGGWINFAEYQKLCLYTPELGYYNNALHKFGRGGDFYTAPEISPIFGFCLANQVAQVLRISEPYVLEAGAGSGALAADLLLALEKLEGLPKRYYLLELSPHLQELQQQLLTEKIPQLMPIVEWCSTPPKKFSGCVFANELLDALPVHLFIQSEKGVFERGVSVGDDGGFSMQNRPASPLLAKAVYDLQIPQELLPWQGEIATQASDWVSTWAKVLFSGAVILIDYGLPAHELYHPQRNGGTLRCYAQQQLLSNPLLFPGLVDITSNVNFTTLAKRAHAAGLEVSGYVSQAFFLINCGLGEILATRAPSPQSLGATQMLLSPNHMGENFKVLALGQKLSESLLGFSQGDRRASL